MRESSSPLAASRLFAGLGMSFLMEMALSVEIALNYTFNRWIMAFEPQIDSYLSPTSVILHASDAALRYNGKKKQEQA